MSWSNNGQQSGPLRSKEKENELAGEVTNYWEKVSFYEFQEDQQVPVILSLSYALSLWGDGGCWWTFASKLASGLEVVLSEGANETLPHTHTHTLSLSLSLSRPQVLANNADLYKSISNHPQIPRADKESVRAISRVSTSNPKRKKE
jgi:hypothetical protein